MLAPLPGALACIARINKHWKRQAALCGEMPVLLLFVALALISGIRTTACWPASATSRLGSGGGGRQSSPRTGAAKMVSNCWASPPSGINHQHHAESSSASAAALSAEKARGVETAAVPAL
jgi:hypothetical protein